MDEAQVLSAMPPEVAAVFAGYPKALRARLSEVRALIFEMAERTGVGPLIETLKWGEPAYLTSKTKAGSTIRLGRLKSSDVPAASFICNTDLVAGFREQFRDALLFEGDRALLLDGAPEDALAICLGRALTYHRDRKGLI